MKKYKKTSLITLLLLVNAGFIFSQQTRIELGNKYYNQQAFEKAIPLYEGAIERGHKNKYTYVKLGDCYYYTSNPEDAVKYYDLAFSGNNPRFLNKHRLKYALCLLSERDTIKAKSEFIKYYKGNEEYNGIENLTARTIDTNSMGFAENLDSINTKNSDFGTYIFNDTLYFASSREKDKKRKQINRKHNRRLYKWNDHPFLEIYSAAFNKNDYGNTLRVISSDRSNIDFNTNAHESSIAILNDSTMFFSGGLMKNKNKLDYNKRGVSNLKLQIATRTDTANNKWTLDKTATKASDFLNLENYSIGNPALSPDKKLLFFVSCAPYPSAEGQSDIYYVNLDSISSPSVKVKSIPGINTNGRESFPYISSDSTLYFSSDGFYNNKLGYGLLDIYKVENIYELIDKDNKNYPNKTLTREELEKKIVHLESPFNSNKDDFAYFLDKPRGNNTTETYAYFSSNRKHENQIHCKHDDIIDCIDDTNNDCIDDEIYRVLVNMKGKIIKQ